MPTVSLSPEVLIGLGAYPDAPIRPAALNQPPRAYGLPEDNRGGRKVGRINWSQSQGGEFSFQFIPQLTQEIDFTIAALKAAASGKPIAQARGLPVTARPGERPDPMLVDHVDRILQLQRAGRSWIYTYPYGEIAAFIPGLTREQLASVKNQLWKPEWGNPATITADIVAAIDEEIAWLEGNLKTADTMLMEISGYEPWLTDVLKQFQTYVNWFQDHLKHKEDKTRAIGVALSAISTVLNFIPVVGNILALVVEAVNVGIQVNAFKVQLQALADAGGRIFAGQVAAAVLEAVAVTKTEVLNVADLLTYELEYRKLERQILGGPSATVTTPLPDPGDNMDDAMRRLNVPMPRPNVMPLALAAGGAAVFAALMLRGRR
ncbi:MAG TPA: hypothetical protein VFH61_03660 [Thermoleophilia bacterium]|nr:hypothetical protein [Thermoleophilia bacterium]